MNCAHVETRLNELLDSHREWQDDASLSRHCSGCDSCRKLAETYAALSMNRYMEFSPSAPADLADRVLASLHPVAPRSSGSSGLTRWRYAAAACVAASLLLAGLFTLARNQNPASPGPPVVRQAAVVPDIEGSIFAGATTQSMASYERMWMAAGRGIAILPRRVDSVTLTGALGAIRELLPPQPATTDPLPQETGRGKRGPLPTIV